MDGTKECSSLSGKSFFPINLLVVCCFYFNATFLRILVVSKFISFSPGVPANALSGLRRGKEKPRAAEWDAVYSPLGGVSRQRIALLSDSLDEGGDK